MIYYPALELIRSHFDMQADGWAHTFSTNIYFPGWKRPHELHGRLYTTEPRGVSIALDMLMEDIVRKDMLEMIRETVHEPGND